jgi:hypothetical protein
MWWAYTRGGANIRGAYSRRFTVHLSVPSCRPTYAHMHRMGATITKYVFDGLRRLSICFPNTNYVYFCVIHI